MQQSKLSMAMKTCKKSFITVGVFSCFINLLMLTIPLYMLQVFDRVLAGFSEETLIYLTLLAVFSLAILSLLDAARMKILNKVSDWLDRSLSPLALVKCVDADLNEGGYTQESLRDLNKIRDFMCGMDVLSFYDAPWTFIYLLVIYILHPMLGFVATMGVLVMVVLSWLNELSSRTAVSECHQEMAHSQAIVGSTVHNSEAIKAMGMVERTVRRWYQQKEKQQHKQGVMSHYSIVFMSLAKFFRMVLQIAILGVGAWLVVRYSSGQVLGVFTAGSMIAASILTSRAMAPVERLITTWKRFLEVRQSWQRVHDFLSVDSAASKSKLLTDFKGSLTFDSVVYQPDPKADPIIPSTTFSVAAGDLIAVIGASGSGKSTLSRLMLGVWNPTSGTVSIDGYDLSLCHRQEVGSYLGYCPQRVSLVHGTIRENITRFQEASDDEVVTAARLVGAHDMILSLPKGYDTAISPFSMSGGQQQRIALARAFFGNPKLIVLDEPDSNLDEEGVRYLGMALQQAKQQGTTVILVTHRSSYLRWVNKMMVIADGRLQVYGPTKQVLERLRQVTDAPSATDNSSH